MILKALSLFVSFFVVIVLSCFFPLFKTQAASQPLVVYSDALASGWANWSFSSTVNLSNTTPVFSGNRSIAYTVNSAWGGLYFRNSTGVNTTGYNTLQFSIRATATNQEFYIFMKDELGNDLKKVKLSLYGGYPSTTSWKAYSIPLPDLLASGKIIKGIIIQDGLGKAQPVVYIDQVTLTPPPVSPTPTSTPTPTPTLTPSQAPTPTPTTYDERLIYSDSLASGWGNWSYDATVQLGNSNPVYSGTHSVSFAVTKNWGALYLGNTSGINTTGLTALQFAAQATSAQKDYIVFLKDSGGNNLTQVELSRYGGFIPVGSWNVYTIPLEELGATNKTITGIFIKGGYAEPLPVIYLDDIKFVSTTLIPTSLPSFTRGIVTITFDDTRATQYYHALPILKKYGLSATFYAISGKLGLTDYYMTRTQLAEVKNAGNEIGSHTVTHPHLPLLTDLQIVTELSQSKSDLASWYLVPVKHFATPYGEYNDFIMSEIMKNYATHRTTIPGYNTKYNFNPTRLKARAVNASTDMTKFMSYIETAKTDKSWAVLMYHGVNIDSDPGTTTPAEFDKQMEYLKYSGMTILTVEQAMQEISPQL